MIDPLTGRIDMHLKLRHPTSAKHDTMAFDAPLGEVSHLQLDPMTFEQAQRWIRANEELGYDARRFAVWHAGDDVPTAMTEISVPRRGEKPLVILTNWNVWLNNQFGATIDRLHRYAPEPV